MDWVPKFSFFCHPRLAKRDFFHWRQTQPLPRECHGQDTGHGFPRLVELNHNIMVRYVERMNSETRWTMGEWTKFGELDQTLRFGLGIQFSWPTPELGPFQPEF